MITMEVIMKKTVYVLFVISLGLFLITLLSYGVLHFGLSLSFFSSSVIIEFRNFLFVCLYIFFLLTALCRFIYYKFLTWRYNLLILCRSRGGILMTKEVKLIFRFSDVCFDWWKYVILIFCPLFNHVWGNIN